MEKRYYADMTLRELTTEIVEVGTDASGSWAFLRETIFYPEGGGEPGDTGTLNGIRVTGTVKAEARVKHLLEKAAAPGPCTAVVDWPRRRRFMQHHTAQHILTALADRLHGWKTISFHLGEDYALIDLEGSGFNSERLEALEEAANASVRKGLPVTAEFMSPERYAREEVRSRLLPGDLEGDIRVVSVEGVDRNTCGGMHVGNTREIQLIRLDQAEKIKEGIRLPYLAGAGILERLRKDQTLQQELKGILGCGPEAFMQTAQAWARERQSSRRNQRRFQEAVLEMLGRGLEERSFHFFPGTDTAFLTKAAPLLSCHWPERTLLLWGEDGENVYFVIRQGEKSSKPAEDVFKKMLELTGGKGGGGGNQFQGKAPAGPMLDKMLAQADGIARNDE
jgi:alanyl-tRNA synthetase